MFKFPIKFPLQFMLASVWSLLLTISCVGWLFRECLDNSWDQVFSGTSVKSTDDTDWNQFRGPLGTGVAPVGSELVIDFDLDRELVWKTDVPGIGWSSPVYSKNRIWMTTSITQLASPEAIEAKLTGVEVPEIKTVAGGVQLRAVCLDLETGSIVHDIELADVSDPEIINPLNSYASPTPAVVGDWVICHFGNYGTWCLDNQTGAIQWERRFEVEHSVGPGSSPVIHKNNVILVCDGMDHQYVAAVDLETGTDLWKTERPPLKPVHPEMRKSFGTPLLVEIAGNMQAIIPAAQWIVGYDPESGRELWRAEHGDGYSIAPVPSYEPETGLIIFATGFARPEFVAVDPTGSGDVTETHIKWRVRNAPSMSSFIVDRGKLYAVNDTGILTCIDIAEGTILSRSRLGGNYSASPILANGHLYFFSREGFVTVFECLPDFPQIGRVNFDNPIMASPAIKDNSIILRTRDSVYHFRKPGIGS